MHTKITRYLINYSYNEKATKSKSEMQDDYSTGEYYDEE